MFHDMAVNAGPYRATKLLQRSLGVAPDGRVGPVTRAAIKSADPQRLIEKYSQAKRNFYIGLGQPRYLHGWLKSRGLRREKCWNASRINGDIKMENEKPWWSSIAIWSSIISALAPYRWRADAPDARR